MPPEKNFKNQRRNHAFSVFFCKWKWSLLQWRQGRIRQQALQNGPIKTSSNLQARTSTVFHAIPRCPWMPNLFLPLRLPPLPSHFSADLHESQDRVLGRLAVAPLCPPPVATLMPTLHKTRDMQLPINTNLGPLALFIGDTAD